MSTIRKIDTSGIITTVAGTAGSPDDNPEGPLTSALLPNPNTGDVADGGIVIDSAGDKKEGKIDLKSSF